MRPRRWYRVPNKLNPSLDAGWLVVPTSLTKNAAALDRLLTRVSKHLAESDLLARASMDEGRASYVRLSCASLVEWARLASLSGAQAGLLRVAGDRGGAIVFSDGERGAIVRGTPSDAATLLAEIGAGTVDQILAAIALHAGTSRPIQRPDQRTSAADPNITWTSSIDAELETDIATDALTAIGVSIEEIFVAWRKRRDARRALDERGSGVDRQTKQASDSHLKAGHGEVFDVVRRVGVLAPAVAMEALVRVLRARGLDPADVEAFMKADLKLTRK